MKLCTLFLLLVSSLCLEQSLVAQQFDPAVLLKSGPGFSLPYSLATCDFNHDGNPDFAVANYTAEAVAVVLGKGDGTFVPPRGIHEKLHPISVACGDVNEDGNLDVVVVDQSAGIAGSLQTILGDGTGKFTPFASRALGVNPFAMVTADFNGDGHLDVAVTQAGGVLVAFGNGDGSFSGATSYSVPGTANGIASADLDGDGHPDLAVTNLHKSVLILRNQGDGTFVNLPGYQVANRTFSVALADLNNDGKVDLVVGSNGAKPDAVTVQLGNGDGTFGPATLYATSPAGTGVRAIAIADFNKDGNLDIATANDLLDGALLYGKGDGTFQSAATIDIGQLGSISIASADFDRDGFPDLIFGSTDTAGDVALTINAQ